MLEIAAGNEESHRKRTPGGTVIVGSCRYILGSALPHGVVLESHRDWHIRFGLLRTRIWPALAVRGIIRLRNRSYRGCAWRPTP